MEPIPLVTRISVGGAGRCGSVLMLKVVLAVALPSLTVIVMSALPITPGNGVTTTRRLLALPPKAMPLFSTTLVLAEVPDTVRLAAGVSESPIVNGIGDVVVPAGVFWPGIVEMVGGLLTVTVKVLVKV